MKNRGFTLLELLGVIVILALLTTLVFPSVLNVIKKSSNKTDELSMKLISNAADLYIDNNVNEFVEYNGNKYIIELEELIAEGNLPSNIKLSDIDNIDDKCIQVTYQDGFKYELKDKGSCEKLVQFDSICKLTSDSTVTGVQAGAKYNCKVDPNKPRYSFYVLNTVNISGEKITAESTDKEPVSVNLIMDRNICYDGSVTEKGKTCLVAWISWEYLEEHASQEDLYNYENLYIYGPVTAMTYLNNATSSWDNIDNLNITYNDESGQFTGFAINGKARLPYKSEVADSNGSNEYLYENLDSANNGEPWYGASGKQPTNNISGIYGYWTLSSYAGNSSTALHVYYGGLVIDDSVTIDSRYGVRAVINLKI